MTKLEYFPDSDTQSRWQPVHHPHRVWARAGGEALLEENRAMKLADFANCLAIDVDKLTEYALSMR